MGSQRLVAKMKDSVVSLNEDALEYHAKGRAGKIKVVPTKDCVTADDLSLAYSPGVAAPCLAIEKNPEDAYKYTAKGNLVAVISNGSAVLGLGNIGALAGKPVMEGKGVLFKRFADVDVFDIEVDSQDVEEIIRFCEMISPTFGGINLEDIRAPECFEIEQRLKASLDIPVFHDDQHGTAIISAAALLNGLKIQDKKIEEVRVVFSGAGAASISCAKLYKDLGVKAENILMTDSQGVMWKGRGTGFNKYKDEFVTETEARTLGDALVGADVFVGLSQAGLVSKDMVRSMADRPLVFAMANPDPEITPVDAQEARPDAICATGRSDYANQVNNVLGFPFIFRGALDVRANKINEEMKQAAVYALAELAQRGEAVPDAVKKAYPGESFDFGPKYIIPKPFDPRVLLYVAPAVAKAAMDSGVAQKPIDLKEYEVKLQQMLGEIASL
jgi:malate dehydrogenase (oxaloacetate-decarboxylating)(NADP+)